MAPYMPFALRIHLAVSLISLLSLGVYLSPAMDLEFNVAGVHLGAVMVLTAVSMVAGWHVGAGVWLLVAAGPIGMLEFGVLPVVERIALPGSAAFLLFTGAGRWSADGELGRAKEALLEQIGRAVWAPH
jgi:hypothetical protein